GGEGQVGAGERVGRHAPEQLEERRAGIESGREGRKRLVGHGGGAYNSRLAATWSEAAPGGRGRSAAGGHPHDGKDPEDQDEDEEHPEDPLDPAARSEEH